MLLFFYDVPFSTFIRTNSLDNTIVFKSLEMFGYCAEIYSDSFRHFGRGDGRIGCNELKYCLFCFLSTFSDHLFGHIVVTLRPIIAAIRWQIYKEYFR